MGLSAVAGRRQVVGEHLELGADLAGASVGLLGGVDHGRADEHALGRDERGGRVRAPASPPPPRPCPRGTRRAAPCWRCRARPARPRRRESSSRSPRETERHRAARRDREDGAVALGGVGERALAVVVDHGVGERAERRDERALQPGLDAHQIAAAGRSRGPCARSRNRDPAVSSMSWRRASSRSRRASCRRRDVLELLDLVDQRAPLVLRAASAARSSGADCAVEASRSRPRGRRAPRRASAMRSRDVVERLVEPLALALADGETTARSASISARRPAASSPIRRRTLLDLGGAPPRPRGTPARPRRARARAASSSAIDARELVPRPARARRRRASSRAVASACGGELLARGGLALDGVAERLLGVGAIEPEPRGTPARRRRARATRRRERRPPRRTSPSRRVEPFAGLRALVEPFVPSALAAVLLAQQRAQARGRELARQLLGLRR